MKTISELLKSEFNITATEIIRLNGYANTNYYVKKGPEKYVLKEYENETGLMELIEAESDILGLLSREIPNCFQAPVRSAKGNYIVKREEGSRHLVYRLLHYIEGDLFAHAAHTELLFESFGNLLARMDKTLLNIRHVAIEARRFEWDILQIDLTKKYYEYIPNPSDRKLVDYFYQQYHEMVSLSVPELRKSIIHADANDLNVIVTDNTVSGIIDFGDVVYSLLVNDPAIAITYAMFGKDDPIKWAKPIIKGYCKILPLEEKEIDLLYYLVGARLCTILCKAAQSKTDHPDDDYLTISEKPAWELLKKWITINPVKASDEFRKAADLESIIQDTTQQDIEKRSNYLSKALSVSYSPPIKMEKAAFQYMYDHLGNTYLDTRNNIPHVGHCHPKVVAAAQGKIARLNTNTRYLYDEMTEYSEKLLAKFPEALNKVFFVNSGSAASDLAIRLALTHTKKPDIVIMEHGYHGNTQLSIDISHYKFSGKGGQGKKDNILVAPVPDTYRGPYNNHDGMAGKMYALDLLKTIESRQHSISAFIAEPIISAAGQVPLPKGYLKEIYPFIRKQGGVCISDEVQTGFGRSGTHFWGYEMSDIVPDIVILGKPIGNGHPMAAVVCTDEIACSFNNGMEFFSSFGGNPVSCATGLAVLEVLEEENLIQNALEVGNYMIEKFNELREEFKYIGDVRGSGLCLGVDIVKDPSTKEPATEIAGMLVKGLKLKKILAGTDGPYDNVLKIKPPLCFTTENVDQLLDELAFLLYQLTVDG